MVVGDGICNVFLFTVTRRVGVQVQSLHEAEVHPQWLLRLLIPSNMLQSDSRASTQLDSNNNSCAGTVQRGLSCLVAFDLLKCPPLMASGLRVLQADICLFLQVRDFLLNQHVGNVDG